MIEYRSVPLVKHVCDALEREVNNAVRSQGMTYSQIQLVLRLSEAESGTRSLKELEAQLKVSQATIAGLVKRLEKKELVRLVDDSDDKRMKHAQITEQGRAKCAEAHQHMDAIELKLRSGLTAIETQLFYELLRKVREVLK